MKQLQISEANEYHDLSSAEMAYEYWLASLYPISCKKRRAVKKLLGSAKRFFQTDDARLRSLGLLTDAEIRCVVKSRGAFLPEAACDSIQQSGIRFILYDSPDYPERLKNIYDPPYALFAYGRPPSDERKSIGIVGARGCSEYGRSVATKLGRTLAEHGVQVVSGLAAGIDSASQAGALQAGGDTFAVLGCGCDICYPRSAHNLYENIRGGHGGILSEYLPGTNPQPFLFPLRNRIISALSDILVVVEAREKSGSLITADLALEQGKDVYAVPGRYLDPLSVGCNHLIEQGAGIFVDMDRFLISSGIVPQPSGKRKGAEKPELTGESQRVYDCLELSVKHIDTITKECGLDFLTVLHALTSLKQKHLAQETFQNYFCRMI